MESFDHFPLGWERNRSGPPLYISTRLKIGAPRIFPNEINTRDTGVSRRARVTRAGRTVSAGIKAEQIGGEPSGGTREGTFPRLHRRSVMRQSPASINTCGPRPKSRLIFAECFLLRLGPVLFLAVLFRVLVAEFVAVPRPDHRGTDSSPAVMAVVND